MTPSHAQPAASRVSAEGALAMLQHSPTAELMSQADAVRAGRHGKVTYFTHSLNINPTNVCENRCELCAFWREPDAPDAYTMNLADIRSRLENARNLGLTDLHVVGGLTDGLGLAYYESVFQMAREVLPGVLVQGLTAVEICHLARKEGLTIQQVLRRLKSAGLGSLPGGGAEIFSDSVRRQVCSKKISAQEWLDVHAQAHAVGLPSNVTMLFGHVETLADIVDHLCRVRELQDRTGGFMAFIALPFLPGGTRLSACSGPSGDMVARVVAVARLFLDNVPHVRVLANYMDRKLLHVLTHGGADDVGPTSVDERIALATGTDRARRVDSVQEMHVMLRQLGLEPRMVNSAYEQSGGNADRLTDIHDEHSAFVPPSNAAKRSLGVTRRHPMPGGGGVVQEMLARASAGGRLSREEAIVIHQQAGLGELGAAAHKRRLQIVPSKAVTFVIDRNINVTNVCETACRFCAFHVAPGSPGAFVMSNEQIVQTVQQAQQRGATQVLIQGGLHPDLGLEFYEEMLRTVKQRTGVWLHSMSPAEIAYLADKAGLSIEQCLLRLRQAGLDSLPGGGAEILVDEIRRQVSPRKISADRWLAVMEAAHRIGMSTTATMVYGLGETVAQRVEHLLRIRELQDRTGGFLAFIPWSCQTSRTQITLRPCTGVDYLRTVALSRLVLDNVPHIQAGSVTEGPDLAQLALSFGADDFGGVLMEERVVRATGTGYAMTHEQVVDAIRKAGFTPTQRTTRYEMIG